MKLTTAIQKCELCPDLVKNRTHVVIGEGPIPCDLLFIGEAPGKKEDETGKPFCGLSGDILEASAFKAGFVRHMHYHIVNVLKCRPPENRDPLPIEIENCRPFLHNQIAVVKPKVIMAFGRFAQAFLLDIKSEDVRVLANAGKILKLTGYQVILSYHPAYVARHRGTEIAKAFDQHFRQAKKLLTII